MPPISFSDEEIELLSALAAALQPAVRGTFLTIVGNALAAYPPEARGPGLLHRNAAAAQRSANLFQRRLQLARAASTAAARRRARIGGGDETAGVR